MSSREQSPTGSGGVDVSPPESLQGTPQDDMLEKIMMKLDRIEAKMTEMEEKRSEEESRRQDEEKQRLEEEQQLKKEEQQRYEEQLKSMSKKLEDIDMTIAAMAKERRNLNAKEERKAVTRDEGKHDMKEPSNTASELTTAFNSSSAVTRDLWNAKVVETLFEKMAIVHSYNALTKKLEKGDIGDVQITKTIFPWGTLAFSIETRFEEANKKNITYILPYVDVESHSSLEHVMYLLEKRPYTPKKSSFKVQCQFQFRTSAAAAEFKAVLVECQKQLDKKKWLTKPLSKPCDKTSVGFTFNGTKADNQNPIPDKPVPSVFTVLKKADEDKPNTGGFIFGKAADKDKPTTGGFTFGTKADVDEPVPSVFTLLKKADKDTPTSKGVPLMKAGDKAEPSNVGSSVGQTANKDKTSAGIFTTGRKSDKPLPLQFQFKRIPVSAFSFNKPQEDTKPADVAQPTGQAWSKSDNKAHGQHDPECQKKLSEKEKDDTVPDSLKSACKSTLVKPSEQSDLTPILEESAESSSARAKTSSASAKTLLTSAKISAAGAELSAAGAKPLKGVLKPTEASGRSLAEQFGGGTDWQCEACFVENPQNTVHCLTCKQHKAGDEDTSKVSAMPSVRKPSALGERRLGVYGTVCTIETPKLDMPSSGSSAMARKLTPDKTDESKPIPPPASELMAKPASPSSTFHDPTSSSTFGGSTLTTSAFGAPVSMTSMFGGLISAASAFRDPAFSASAFGSATSTSVFGPAASTTSVFSAPASTTSVFGPAASTTSVFGAPASTTSVFGAPASTTSVFGAPASTTSAFGAPASTTSGFGTPASTTSVFGAPASTTSAFGAPASTTSVFGAPASTTSAFGAPASTTSVFGAPASTTSVFGAPASTTSAFGGSDSTTSAFGGVASTTPAFGGFASTPSAFGELISPASSFRDPTSTTSALGGSAFTPFALGGVISPASAFRDPLSTSSAFGASMSTALEFGGAPVAAPVLGDLTSAAVALEQSTKDLKADIETSAKPHPESTLNDDKVEIVETILPSAKLIKKAEEFQLPKSFYNYETSAVDCPGCIGCDPDDFDFSTIGQAPDPDNGAED